jgi:hypothetical protein
MQFLDERVQAGAISAETASKTMERILKGNTPLEIFAWQLRNRQGTFIPDFDALNREREELNRKAFQRDQPPPESLE